MSYTIRYWVSEAHRDQGESDILDSYEDRNAAIEYAQHAYYSGDLACVEVEDEHEQAVYHLSSDGEEHYFPEPGGLQMFVGQPEPHPQDKPFTTTIDETP